MMGLASTVCRLSGEREEETGAEQIDSADLSADRNIACKARRGSLLGRIDPVLGAKSVVRDARGPSSPIFDDLDLGSTRKPGPKAKLPVPVEGGLVRSPAEVRGR